MRVTSKGQVTIPQPIREQLGIQPPASYAQQTGGDPIPSIADELGAEAFAAAVERGRRLSLEGALDVIEELVADLPVESRRSTGALAPVPHHPT